MQAAVQIEAVQLNEQTLAELRRLPTFASLESGDMALLADARWERLGQGEQLLQPVIGDFAFWALVEGEISIDKLHDGRSEHLMRYAPGETFGEVPLLSGWRVSSARCMAITSCRLLRIPQDSFWRILADLPAVREKILADHSRRAEAYQAVALHREKLISLGTLAAGLMHELNNPGSAARRAAAHLRENVENLQQISLRMCRAGLSPGQLECLAALQEQTLHPAEPEALTALEQADREEQLEEWLQALGIANAARIAPTMAQAGWGEGDLSCAHKSFPPDTLSDALNYLHALMSSLEHVHTIEQSIGRVTDLVSAVKKYAYDDKNRQGLVDVRETLQSTLTILGHKFRHKGIHVEIEVAPGLLPSETKVVCAGSGLAQVWTNLLDNAIDAAPENGEVGIHLWAEGAHVCVAIRDNGPGIAPEHQGHIFKPFFTTKEPGVGTGLGLDIAHRIVAGNFGGDIRFSTEPGRTEFLVRLLKNNPGCGEAFRQIGG